MIISLAFSFMAVSFSPLVCRFVRREKEIAESRFEVVQGESLRHRLRVEHLERELKDVQESLSAERERMQVGLENPMHSILFLISYTS